MRPIGLLVIVLAAVTCLVSSRGARADAVDRALVTLLHADSRYVVVRVQAPDVLPATVPGSAPYARLDVPDMSLGDSPGRPALPYTSSLLAIPPDADVSVSVLSADCRDLAGRWRIEPAPTWSLGVSGPDYVQQIQRDGPRWQASLHEDAAVYTSSAYFPAQAARATEPQIMRSRRLVSLEVYPWQVSPATGRVRYCRTIDVQVSFSRPAQVQETLRTPDPTFDSTFANSVLNWSDARTWQASGAPAEGFVPDTWEFGLRVTVAGPGLYRLTYTDLVNAGVPVTGLIPATLRMSLREQDVAVQVTGEGDGHFDPGDEVRFYVAPYINRYSTTAVYWLRWGDAPGLRMADRDAAPAGASEVTSYTRTLRLEVQEQYRSEAPAGQNEDHWFYQQLYAYAGHETDIKSYPFTTPDVSGDPGITVTARLLTEDSQAANPDHWIRLWLNGQVAGAFAWDGAGVYTATTGLPATALQASNVLTGEISLAAVPGVSAYFMLPDWFKIQYRALLQAVNGQIFIEQPPAGLHTFVSANFPSPNVLAVDVSDSLYPVILTGLTSTLQGSTYTMRFQTTGDRFQMAETGASLRSAQSLSLVNSPDLRNTALGADYVLIGPSDLLGAAQPLVTKRQSQGLRVQTVDVQDIFDQFAGGFREPQALRDFLTYAYFNWQAPAPTYVALLGDGHYDFRDDTGFGYRNPIPPYLVPIDPWIGETVSDNRLVSVDGPADYLPDMDIGRMPANTTQDVQNMLAKMFAYDAAAVGAWQTDAVYTADMPDDAGNFHAISDEVRFNWLTADMVSVPLYSGSAQYPDGPAVFAALLTSWSDGSFYTQWFGHGNRYRWGNSRVLSTAFESILPVTDKLPLLAEWGCWTGYFILVDGPSSGLPNFSLSEMMVRTPGKGAINDISATGLHTSPPLTIMHHGLHKSLFGDRDARAGAAFTAMKLFYFANTGAWHDVIDTTALFGDPAQVLRLPVGDLSTSSAVVDQSSAGPDQNLNYTVTVRNTTQFTVAQTLVQAAYPGFLVDVTNSGGATNDGSTLTWPLFNLASNGSRVYLFTLRTKSTLPAGTTNLVVPVQFSSIMAPTVTQSPSTQLSGLPLQVTADLQSNRSWVPPGQTVSYTLHVSSTAGTGVASDTWITLTLPAELGAPQNLSATVSNPVYDPQAHQITWYGPVFFTTPVTISFDSLLAPDLTACGQVNLSGQIRDVEGQITNVATTVHPAVPDVDCSGAVNIIDVQQVAAAWGSVAGNPPYDPRLDLNGDDVIGLPDILIVAGHWQ